MPYKVTIPRACEQCGITFFVSRSRMLDRPARHCSRACRYTESLEDRFWSKVDKDGPVPSHVPHLGPCWVWTGARDYNGYGHFLFERRNWHAHRIAYMLANGPLPSDKPFVTHRCDGGAIGCVRPDHLQAGTRTSNIAEAVERKRMRHGEQANKARLTREKVLDIRARVAAGTATRKQLADEYGVVPSAISNVVTRVTWAHVT